MAFVGAGVEQSVLSAVLTILQDEAALTSDLLEAGLPASDVPALLANARRLSSHTPALLHQSTEAQGELAGIVERVELSSGRMQLALRLPTTASPTSHSDDNGKLMINRSVPHRLQRRGRELRLVLGGGAEQTRDDPALLKLVARAHCWFEDIVSGRVASAHELARQLNVSSRYVQRLLPLALLAPSMVERIAAGHQDPTLTADAVSGLGNLPLRWSEHADLLLC